MSLYYVNDHLIHEEVKNESQWPNTNEKYKRIMIESTSQAVRKDDSDNVVPFSKPICVHNCSLNPTANTRISSVITEGMPRTAARVTIRTSSDTRYNSDIFVVALPYEGMIQPFEHNQNALAIYKCQIVKSERYTIEHNDGKYRRVVYFVVKPNHQFLGGDGWYDNNCDLKVTFVKSDKARKDQTGNDKWLLTTVTVRFGEDGKYTINEETSEAPADSFNPESIRSAQICQIVDPTELPPRDQPGQK